MNMKNNYYIVHDISFVIFTFALDKRITINKQIHY